MSKTTLLRTLKCTLAAAFCGVSLTACSDLARTGSGPSFLVVQGIVTTAGGSTLPAGNGLQSDVATSSGAVFPDFGQATIRVELKNQVSATAPTSINAVTINRYRVRFRRTDGQNREGVDVPFSFEGATSTTIDAGGVGTVTFDLVRHQSKLEPPLRTLMGNGGVIVLSTIADVTFYGFDQAGNDVTVSASVDVKFGDFPDS
jgi:hypothetical protein